MRAACSNHDTSLPNRLVNLADGVDEAGVSVGEVSLDSDVPVFTDGAGHDLLKSRVDDVDLIGTFNLVRLGLKTHKLEELDLGLLLVLLGHTSWGDVIEVLEPFEVRAGDTTTVDKHVWGGDNSSAGEDLLGGVGCGAVGTFEDGLDLDVFGVASVEGLLGGSGDHAVGSLEEEGLRVLTNSLSGIGISGEGAVLDHEVLDLLIIKTCGVVDGRVVFNDSGDQTTVLLDELGGPVADGTEALDDEGLVLDASGEANAVGESLGVEEFTHSVVDTETGGLGTAGNTTLGDELTSAASLGVDVGLTTNVHVGVLDPGHGLFVGTHVGSEAINLGTDKALLDELHGVLTGDSLDLVLGVLLGVNLDTTLSTTEGYIGDGELECHQGGQGLDFLQINVFRVASATFDGQLVS